MHHSKLTFNIFKFGWLARYASTSKVTEVKVYRYVPEVSKKPYLQTFSIEKKNVKGRMVLDLLNSIKDTLDSSLSYRRSCREGICGSCAMNINGVNALACITTVTDKVIIYPLPHSYVIRDLVVDMQMFYDQYKSIMPYMIKKSLKQDDIGKNTILQSINDSKKLEELYECILCACCSSSCPSYWWNSPRFLGPAALLHAYRWVIDSRDDGHEERMNQLKDNYSLFRCHTISNCTIVCPKNLNPAKAIAELKLLVSKFKKKQPPEPIKPIKAKVESDINTKK
uniref:Succinate dehydrogenase [ubiquinone] iron-sulfur subunit, mitochondrial n=1 Tax=Clastoptera arizonana TaxID=38151 RepID=A0A1B6DT97_9HEMI